MRIFCPAMVLILALLGPLNLKAQPPGATPDLAANAAIQYWQAFAQMPVLDKNQEQLLENWNTVPLDAAAEQLVAASHSSLMYLYRGAKLERCDWGLDYNDGISLMVPHLAKARDLARLAALHGRFEFEHGRRQAVRDDATAIMTLARHVGRDPIMVCLLVRYAIEGAVVDLVAPNVPEMKVPHVHIVGMYDALPKAATLHETIFTEKKFITEWIVKKLKEEEQRKKGAGYALFKKIVDQPDAAKEVRTFDEAIRWTEELIPVYDRIAILVDAPKAEFDQQYQLFRDNTMNANPLAKYLLPPIEKVRAKEDRNAARMAMLIAAIAVATEGPEKLKIIHDPFGTGPFEYRVVDGGFELKSKLVFEDQPVTLTVGQHRKN